MTHICINTLCLYIFYSRCFCVDWLFYCENMYMCFFFEQQRTFFNQTEECSEKVRHGGSGSSSHDTKLLQGGCGNHMSVTNMVWASLYFIFSWPLAVLPIFFSGGYWNGQKGSSLRLLRFLLCKSCIGGRGFRYDLMQLPSFMRISGFRDGQETLMGISYFTCLSHIPLSGNLGKVYHRRPN